MRIHSAVGLVGSADWDEARALSALVDFVRPGLTASQLGVGWQQREGYEELDGLWTLVAAIRGKYLLISDDPKLMKELLANVERKSGEMKPADFIAGFNHKREQENFARLTTTDRWTQLGTHLAPLRRSASHNSFSETIASLELNPGWHSHGKYCDSQRGR